ncbi:hypothetical protein [Methylobacterium sp. AMS5]|uniref:hypothetical protein n=1 Tax=Methylobacterium sp. AMS5 TaxID=925818 RepID=UPI00074F9FAE|nr:hypothetical protein [Methylobacterium sp. AMS5]AMB46832.1 hypothetical protein Y590_17990 [Methylobacterium sp. AMS5]
MNDLIEHFRTAACGLAVAHVWRGHGSALFVELGALTSTTRRVGSPGQPEGEIGLMIEWSWRIEDARSIACGSWSDDALWQPSFDRLVGREVIDLTTFGRLPEVMLSLSGDLHVVSFMTAEGDPEWSLFDRRGPKPITIGSRSGTITEEV